MSEFHNRHPDLVKTIKNNFASVIEKVSFSDELSEFLIANQDSIEFDFNKMNQESYVEMIKVLYYHHIIEDIFDVKFV